MRIQGSQLGGMSNLNLNNALQGSVRAGMATAKAERQDKASISPLGKVNNIIKNLMEQKQRINDQKNELISNTMDNDGNMANIKSQLESYEKQLEEIDKQIFEANKQLQETKVKEKPKEEQEKQDELQKNLKQEGFHTVDAKVTSAFIKTSSAMELSNVAKGAKSHAERELRLAKFYNRPAKEIFKIESAIKRSTEAMMSAAGDASKAMSNATKPSDHAASSDTASKPVSGEVNAEKAAPEVTGDATANRVEEQTA